MTIRPGNPRRALWLALAVCLPALSGCVQRWLLIRSDPPGAQIYLDAHSLGPAPVRVAFEHYGTREVLARLGTTPPDGPAVHYESAVEIVTLETPWYQWFPLDLFSSYLYPGTIIDEHEVTVHLRPVDAAVARKRLDEVLTRQAVHAAPLEPRP